MTVLPNGDELSKLKGSLFKGTDKDYAPYIELLKGLGVSSVLDYGCSWGYGVFQFRESGLNASGLEISQPRADFGEANLGVKIARNAEQLGSKTFDAVFSAHVLEHFSNPRIALEQWQSMLRPGGYLILEVPNCGGAGANAQGVRWGPFSGVLHPLSITQAFLSDCLPRHGLTPLLFPEQPATDSDARAIVSQIKTGSSTGDCRGDALVCIAQRTLITQ